MRCTSCGLPLSPARTMTSCPRCGTPIVDKKSPTFPAQQPYPQTETWKPVAPQTQLPEVVRSSMSHPEDARELKGAAQAPLRATTGSDPFHSPGAHVQSPVTAPPASPAVPTYVPQPTPQLDPMWLPTPASQGNQGFDAQQVQEYGQAGLGGFRPEAIGANQSAMGTRELIGAPQAPLRPLQHDGLKRGTINRAPMAPTQSKNNLGFIVAGLCVIMGGLILVFVYIMALGSPGNSNSSNTLKTNTTTTSSPISASSPASSPTATPFPGQKYIDHAQLASSIDPTSRQAIQLTMTFKANQNIYITFQVHPNGQSGAACLLWYVNNKVFFPFALPVYPNERATYSYASYGGTGSGYVEIYWASTTKCTDKILAQHVDFTVTS